MNAKNDKGVVIIGANLAGGRAAEGLRRAGYEGPINLIGSELARPYDRPSLSKDVLINKGELPRHFYLHEENFFDENLINTHFGHTVTKLDLIGRRVNLDDGREIDCDKIVLCTGARARKLNIEGSDLQGIHYLRTLEDAQKLEAYIKPGLRVGIVGMGVIGAEVASSLKKRGCEVVAIEPLNVPMERCLGPKFGEWVGKIHKEEGVDLRTEVGVAGFVGSAGRLTGLTTSAGETISIDLAVVGIGVIPNVELAEEAGIEVNNGVVVNHFSQTSHPNVFAAGDVANAPLFYGGHGRVESYQNAQDQAIALANNIAGKPDKYFKPQWVWSDQYDMNIQMLGDIISEADIIIRGDQSLRSFSAFYIRDGLISGVMTVNAPKDMTMGRRLLEQNVVIDSDVLSDPSTDLRGILKAWRIKNK